MNLTSYNGITLIGDISFKDLNENVKYVSILRSKLQFIKFLPIFTKSISHFQLILITNTCSYILSPRGKLLYVIKPDTRDLIFIENEQKKYILNNEERYYYNKFVNVVKEYTILEFALYMKNLMNKYKYSFYNHNCQEMCIKTVSNFVEKYDKKAKLGFNLFMTNVADLLYEDSYL